MSNVLITGKNGYVGNNLYKSLQENGIEAKKISVRNNEWLSENFEGYTTLVHLAALVHNNTPDADASLYDKVNSELTFELAKKAKQEGIKHFVFFSTLSVYGLNGQVGKNELITRQTALNPTTDYGISKLKAEGLLSELQDDNFKVTVLRPPMIYGQDAPGNFVKLEKFAEKVPFSLNIPNKRSAIYIDNLVRFLIEVIKHPKSGIYHPQNSSYLSTGDIISITRRLNNKKTITLPFPNLFYGAINKIGVFKKVYGNLVIDFDIDENSYEYDEVPYKESLETTLGANK